MELLWNAGCDLLMIETQPSLSEVLIETQIAESLNAEYWVSFPCKDGAHIHEGDRIADCAAALSKGHPHLKMIGVNCTPPQFISRLICQLSQACNLPIGVYPTSGEVYDPATKTWYGSRAALRFGDYARRWMMEGVSAVDGCCQTGDTHISDVTKFRVMVLPLKK